MGGFDQIREKSTLVGLVPPQAARHDASALGRGEEVCSHDGSACVVGKQAGGLVILNSDKNDMDIFLRGETV